MAKTADLEHFQLFLGRGLIEPLHLPEKFPLLAIGTLTVWFFLNPFTTAHFADFSNAKLTKWVHLFNKLSQIKYIW